MLAMYMKRKAVLPLTLSALVLAACGEADDQEETGADENGTEAETEEAEEDGEGEASGNVEGEEIELVYVAWESELASTNVITQVLEEYGYDVEMTQSDQSPMWQATADGSADGFVAAWLPSDMADDYERYGDEVVDLGANLEGAKTGLVVPEYMEDVNSIEDVTSEHFDEITGIDAGAGVVITTEEVIEEYDLDVEMTTSTDAAMTAELDSRYQEEEPVIVTGWEPHWKFYEYDLKFLEDPKEVYADGEEIRTMVREGLEEDHPEAYQILDNFHWTPDDMNEVMLDISEGGMDPEEAAAEWIENNREQVDEWLDID
ncbi:glycine betaine ABC transporter substrate-binding protein [Salsuginibacillus kocurii]|uniref:glycine betaine ABC transporter substrate-binding protein n=1 Tax=Salsuginibacillus kocurii TaxID=427078 RepID=UPI000378BD3C|nr:glycine betaine ABC transporter substrate-binding protein [Salsuginibacillus kocurii]